jgi:hypothetical protein
MRDFVEMDTNEAISLERDLGICYITVPLHAQKCSYNKNNI